MRLLMYSIDEIFLNMGYETIWTSLSPTKELRVEFKVTAMRP